MEMYYALQLNLQILRSVLLDAGASRTGDFKSCSVFIEGFCQSDHIRLNVYILHVH